MLVFNTCTGPCLHKPAGTSTSSTFAVLDVLLCLSRIFLTLYETVNKSPWWNPDWGLPPLADEPILIKSLLCFSRCHRHFRYSTPSYSTFVISDSSASPCILLWHYYTLYGTLSPVIRSQGPHLTCRYRFGVQHRAWHTRNLVNICPKMLPWKKSSW